jgi:hypothetical protein
MSIYAREGFDSCPPLPTKNELLLGEKYTEIEPREGELVFRRNEKVIVLHGFDVGLVLCMQITNENLNMFTGTATGGRELLFYKRRGPIRDESGGMGSGAVCRFFRLKYQPANEGGDGRFNLPEDFYRNPPPNPNYDDRCVGSSCAIMGGRRRRRNTKRRKVRKTKRHGNKHATRKRRRHRHRSQKK